MRLEKLRDEVEIELEDMSRVLAAVESLVGDARDREAGLIETTACATFLAQFYGGVERVLQRICRHLAVTIPQGPTWHAELMSLFTGGDHPPQGLISPELAEYLGRYRSIRHIVIHGYGHRLEWRRLLPAAEAAKRVFDAFEQAARGYLESLAEQSEGGAEPHNPTK
jgi:hypothetical protein